MRSWSIPAVRLPGVVLYELELAGRWNELGGILRRPRSTSIIATFVFSQRICSISNLIPHGARSIVRDCVSAGLGLFHTNGE